METVKLDFIKHEPKTSKAGKPYTACSIKVGETWYNGFGNAITQTWQSGATIDVILFEEEYNGKMYKKFKTTEQSAVDQAYLANRPVSHTPEAIDPVKMRHAFKLLDHRISVLEALHATQTPVTPEKPVKKLPDALEDKLKKWDRTQDVDINDIPTFLE
tara:strand:+ start:1488 stop:1964 length:477 start_codon:yes stop_codon:yes gene_type:complete